MIPQCDPTDPEVEHDWELDYTDKVHGTFQGVEIKDGVIIVDTCSNKMWEEETDWQQVKCQACGVAPDMGDLNIEWN